MKLLLGLALGYAGFFASQTLTLATPVVTTHHSMATLSQKVYFNPPPPPKDPPPGGRVLGGATRGSCPQVKLDLTALVPFTQEPHSVTNVWSLTTAAHPTFWFYVPYSQNVSPAMFVLQDQNSNQIYEKAIAPPTNPGIISVSLPVDAPKLAVNQQYRWFLTFSCDTAKQSPPVYVEGVIKRVNLSSEITKQLQTATPLQQFAIYSQNGIWHEALTTLAKLRQKNPEDTALKTQWQDLLVSIHLGDVATEPIVLDKP